MDATRPAPLTDVAADGTAIATLIERIVRGIERGGRGWTTARKKESLQRVLDGSRSDAQRLQQRLSQLVASWDGDAADAPVVGDVPEVAAEVAVAVAVATPQSAAPAAPDQSDARTEWQRGLGALGVTVEQALAARDGAADVLAAALSNLRARIASEGANAGLIDELDGLCTNARHVLQHRHHVHEQLAALCGELTASLTDLSEDDSWARGQCEAMQRCIDEGLNARGVRAVSELLRDTRERQGVLRAERSQARDALKGLIQRMLSELDVLGSQTGQFHDSVGRYAEVIERADSLETLAGAVREMVEESRSVQTLVQQTQARLQNEHRHASALTQRVSELEAEMQRLSNEVSTDQLTQIANRRGLLQAFEAERARLARSGSLLCVGLLDIDNFKRLNDELGHAAGDVALKALAARVSTTLRPTDHVARYGGEEFVVLLPDTPLAEAQQILTRLQRSLSGGLFMHEHKQVLVTFSAGVTTYRAGELFEAALVRADQALYEAKRTGKNRTCMA